MNVCVYCQKKFSNKGGLGSHQPFCKLNPNRVQRPKLPNAHPKKGSTNWAKGLTKETDSRIKAKPNQIGKRLVHLLMGILPKLKNDCQLWQNLETSVDILKGQVEAKKVGTKEFFVIVVGNLLLLFIILKII